MTDINSPFKILALAPFCPVPASDYTPRPMDMDMSFLDGSAGPLAFRHYLPVDRELCPAGSITLEMNSLADFKPRLLVNQNDYLKSLVDARDMVKNSLSGGVDPTEISGQLAAAYPDLPRHLTVPPPTAPRAPKSDATVDDILSMVALPDEAATARSAARSDDWACRFESTLSDLLRRIYNDPEFRTFEAAWRGLELLMRQGGIKDAGRVLVSVAPIGPNGLVEALNGLSSQLADDPPNLVLVDLPLDAGARSTAMLEALADFAESLLTPTVCWIDSGFFHLPDWTGLKKVAYLKHHLEDASYAKWRGIRESSGASWLAITCNRFLSRLGYGRDRKARPVDFEEDRPLWLSPVWAAGTVMVQSLNACGWPTRFTDYVKFALTDLPLAEMADQGPMATEMAMPEDRLMEFIEAGIMPLLGPLRKDTAFFPKEVSLAGGSVKFQLFFSRLLGFLFRYRADRADAVDSNELAVALTAGLTRFWVGTGQPVPEDLEIRPLPESDDGVLRLRVGLTPPAALLPGGSKVEFTFSW